MARIIDKILARRKEIQAECLSQAALSEPSDQSRHLPNDNHNHRNHDPSPPLPPIHNYYYSFEYFPPKTEPGLDNLLTRIDRMSRRLDPLFVSITWGANGSTLSRTLALASHAQRYACVDVLLHLSCTGMTREQIAQVLDAARKSGVHNVLALRGDPPPGRQRWGPGDVSGGECDRAIDLVRLIRKLHGDYFGVGVAGHPEGHPSSETGKEGKELELRHLKEKLEVGADFIITQFFYDVDLFLGYVRRCRGAGITCPIIAGIMPIQSYSSLLKMTQFCGISVPKSVLHRLEGVRHDDEAVKKIGCEIASEMCRSVLSASNLLAKEKDGVLAYSGVDGFHFYTLNLERSTTRILAALGAVDIIFDSKSVPSNKSKRNIQNGDGTNDLNADSQHSNGSSSAATTRRERNESISEEAMSTRRVLPWKPSAMANRSKEDVRPINWSNRPKSYVMRTDEWDEFPNGRWGDSTSPAFGELSDVSHFYSFTLGSEDDRRAMLGHCPLVETDIYEVFARYVEGTVPHIPWCETPLQPESFLIQPQLAKLNRYGFLTINSQPPVDGLPSSHPVFGWGGKGGRVYQKAYFEFFLSPDKVEILSHMVTCHPNLNLYAVNNAGRDLKVGVEEGGVTALTWGVFPNREILQPTIFDPDIFLVWAEEAFSLWSSMWLNLYDFGSASYEMVENIRDTYYLVAIIDNEFTDGGKSDVEFSLLAHLLAVGNKFKM
ncbi:hypothetical protein ACHAXS_010193 [Conticribra weissflogii]